MSLSNWHQQGISTVHSVYANGMLATLGEDTTSHQRIHRIILCATFAH